MPRSYWLWLRRFSQGLFFGIVVAYFLLATYPLQPDSHYDLVQRFSPLLAATTMIAGRAFIHFFLPALAVVLISALLGRVFCGWVCPVGTLSDVFDAVTKRRRRENPAPRHFQWRYLLLIALVIFAAFGVSWAGWFDPLSLFTRTLAVSLVPYAAAAFDGVTRLLYKVPALAPAASAVRQLITTETHALFPGHWVVTAWFLAILALGLVKRRFYCRYVCPTGALLGLLALVAPLRRRVSSPACNDCGACVNVCRAGAIRNHGAATAQSACTYCLECLTACRREGNTFSFARPPKTPSPAVRDNAARLSRRGFLITTGASLAAAPLLTFADARAARDPFLIRPPGAAGEDDFLALCVRCGECTRVCLTQGLAPVHLEAGLTGLWTPLLIPRRGYCEYRCTMCGQVCPSGAIARLTEAAKQRVVIGTAVINRKRCLPWTGADDCSVCEEMCPVAPKAIIHQGRGRKKPTVVAERCIGCGICEYACPVEGVSAIRVYNRSAVPRAPTTTGRVRYRGGRP